MNFASLLLLCILPQGGDGDAALGRAKEEVRRADEAVAVAETALVDAYQDFEKAIARARRSPLAPRLGAKVSEALAAARGEAAAGRLDPTQRKRAAEDLRARLLVTCKGEIPDRILPAVTAKLADLLAPAVAGAGPDDAAAKAAADLAARWFDPTVPVHELWNRDLFKEVPAARDYAKARSDQLAANEKVSRIEHPERFHAAFAAAPEGMIFVIGGTYTLGPSEGYDIDGAKRKAPFPAKITPFYLDRTEVTNKQYHDYLRALPRADAIAHAPLGWEKSAKEGYALYPSGAENLPVTGVSYEDAAAYATWAKKRLPTEDEWEAAARGPRGNRYPWGSDYVAKRANDASAETGDVAPVGTFPGDVSHFGALDLAGNVMEWTGTLEGGKQAPPRLAGNVGVVLRGGSYDREPKKCSAVYRWIWPGKTTKVRNLGFRCAKDAF